MSRTRQKKPRPRRQRPRQAFLKRLGLGRGSACSHGARSDAKQVADAARCSESFVSKLENDKANPSFTMLHRLTGILGANVAALFAASDETGGVISHPGSRPVILTDQLRVGKGIKLERLIPYSHGYLLQGNIHHIDNGGRSDGNIVHSGEEIGYVLEGEIELTVDGRRYRAKMGIFHFRSELPHGYRNVGVTPARIIWINTPPTF